MFPDVRMGEANFIVEGRGVRISVGDEGCVCEREMIKLKLQSGNQRISAGDLPTT